MALIKIPKIFQWRGEEHEKGDSQEQPGEQDYEGCEIAR